jgi:hypothetical protein
MVEDDLRRGFAQFKLRALKLGHSAERSLQYELFQWWLRIAASVLQSVRRIGVTKIWTSHALLG